MKFIKERANRKFNKSAVIKIETKRKYRETRRGELCFANEAGLSFALVKRSKIQRCIAMRDAARLVS